MVNEARDNPMSPRRDEPPEKKPRLDPDASAVQLPDPASTRLLLANLDYDTTEGDIVDFFRDAGADVTEVSLVRVQPGNRVNGNAYVWLKDERSVDVVLLQDGLEFRGRKLRVSTMPEHQRTACVRGMPLGSTEKDVRELFRGSDILDARSRPVKGGPPDMATWFVDFGDEESFRRALAKDRSAKGLTICIATAQNRSLRGTTGGRRDDMRDDRRDGYERERRDVFDRDRGRDGYERERGRDGFSDRRGAFERPDRSRDGYERPDRPRDGLERQDRPRNDYERERGREEERKPWDEEKREDRREEDPDRNGVSNGPRDRYRSRSRSPLRHERERRFEGRDRDRRDRRLSDGDSYGRYGRERLQSSDRHRDWDRDRDYDTRDAYRRDRYHDDRYGSRYDRHEPRYDRDHRRDRDRDRDRRDMGRGRFERDQPDTRNERDRERRDRELDTNVTAVLTNLPFCEDRDHVIDTLGRTLEDVGDNLKIRDIIPVGRRCGACVVVFQDEASHGRALAMSSISINSRKVNILPLEIPSVARLQKLHSGFSVDDILEDMRRSYGVESLFVKMKQIDQLLLGVEDSRYLVRLLDIDGRPLLHSRYATISYIPSRNHGDGMGGRPRKSPDDFHDPNGRDGGSRRDRDGRDDRGGSPGGSRRRPDEGGSSDRRDAGSDSRRGAERERPSHNQDAEWTVKLSNPTADLPLQSVKDAVGFLGIRGCSYEVHDPSTVLVHGGENTESDMKEIRDVAVANLPRDFGFDLRAVRGIIHTRSRKRSLRSEPTEDRGPSPSPAKKQKGSGTTWESKQKMAPLRSALAETDNIHISPMTPSPADYSSTKLKKTLDPNLPAVAARVDRLRATINSGRAKDRDNVHYGTYCDDLLKHCSPQTLVYTMRDDVDLNPPVKWNGTIVKGVTAKSTGYLVQRSTQGEEEVEKAIKVFPTEMNIGYKASASEDKFSHFLTPDTVVLIAKAKPEEHKANAVKEEAEEITDMAKAPGNRGNFNGILQSLRNKQKMGLMRYTHDGVKHLMLAIPPNPAVYDKLQTPWRFRDFAGHDSLLLIAGPRYATSEEK